MLSSVSLLAVSLLFGLGNPLDNGVALTPPMGWSTWNYHHRVFNESTFYNAATIMISSGMQDVGYEYINVDGGWWARNGTAKSLIRNATGYTTYSFVKYPNGIKKVIEYIHSKGFKYGHYTDAGQDACDGDKLMSQDYTYQDLSLFINEYDIDMIKIDACNIKGNWTENIFRFSNIMNNLTLARNKSVLFSNCRNGCMNDSSSDYDKKNAWQPYCIDKFNMWRISNDISSTWTAMLHNIDCCKYMGQYGQPGAWNDPDFLEVGNGEFEDTSLIKNNSDITHILNINRAHFSLWCIASAPLIAGNNLGNMTDNIKNILINKNAIDINQNYLNNAGDIIEAFNSTSKKLIEQIKIQKNSNGNMTDIWYKPLPSNIGNAAILFLNRNSNKDATYNISVEFIDLPLKMNYCDLYDIWDNKTTTNQTGYTAVVPYQSVKFLKLTNCRN